MNALPVILLIGGDEPLLEGVARALVDAGASARRASCALALQAVATERPDAVLLMGEAAADGSTLLDALAGKATSRVPVLVLRDSDEAPRGPRNRAIATVRIGEPSVIASRTLSLARELRPAPVRIRASVKTARFGSLPPPESTAAGRERARRSSRLRMQFRTIAGGASLSDVPRELEKRVSVNPARRRATTRASGSRKGEPSSSIARKEMERQKGDETALASTPLNRRYLVIGALLVALILLALASMIR